MQLSTYNTTWTCMFNTRPKVFIVYTHFFEMLCSVNENCVNQFLRGQTLLELEIFMIPVNIGQSNWILVLVELRKNFIVYLDPFHENLRANVLPKIEWWLHTICGGTWEKVQNPDWLPKQHDGSSCGIFVIYFAESIERGLRPIFRQEDIVEMRARSIIYLKRQELPLWTACDSIWQNYLQLINEILCWQCSCSFLRLMHILNFNYLVLPPEP